MGKSPKPLSFLVHPSLVKDEDGSRQVLVDLEAQGHTVIIAGSLSSTDPNIDLILGPNCWRAFDLTYLDLAIKSARSVKYGTTKWTAKTKKSRAPRKKKGSEGPEQSE